MKLKKLKIAGITVLLIMGVLAFIPSASATELDETNNTLYLHSDFDTFWMNTNKAAENEDEYAVFSDGDTFDCALTPALSNDFAFDTTKDVKVVMSVEVTALGGYVPAGATYTITLDLALNAGSKSIGSGSGSTELSYPDTTEAPIEIQFKPSVDQVTSTDGNIVLSVTIHVEGANMGSVIINGQYQDTISYIDLPIIASAPIDDGGDDTDEPVDGGEDTETPSEPESKTPGFEAVMILATFGMVAMIAAARRKN